MSGKNGFKWKKWHKMGKMAYDGMKWHKMVQNGQKWHEID